MCERRLTTVAIMISSLWASRFYTVLIIHLSCTLGCLRDCLGCLRDFLGCLRDCLGVLRLKCLFYHSLIIQFQKMVKHTQTIRRQIGECIWPISQNGQTHSNNSSANWRVYLANLWDGRLKG